MRASTSVDKTCPNRKLEFPATFRYSLRWLIASNASIERLSRHVPSAAAFRLAFTGYLAREYGRLSSPNRTGPTTGLADKTKKSIINMHNTIYYLKRQCSSNEIHAWICSSLIARTWNQSVDRLESLNDWQRQSLFLVEMRIVPYAALFVMFC